MDLNIDKVLIRHIESLVFCSSNPLSVKEIQECLAEMFESKISLEEIEKSLSDLQERYQQENISFELVEISNGFQFLTKPAYQASIAILLKNQSKKRMSTSALETLAIIAYKQPITKSEIEQIRGVGSDYTVNKLLEKELVNIRGKADTVGKPVLYGTGEKFMEYFGIRNIEELPVLKDFRVDEENVIGEERE